ncbi:MAG TPA: branched-chain amino acid ABC transporter permease, partial [Pseudorhizobium sp.]|nr:branched-chain amino acid ABC transporter permease [Pseudorhizobium sp.]
MLTRENLVNLALALLLLAVPLAANALGEPFYVTLATRVAILALAATGLNIALGLGGLVSFGHAAFFGIGGYAAGILATHAFSGDPLLFGLSGTNQMPVIWLVAMLVAGVVGLFIGSISLRTSGVYFIMITLAFAQMVYYFAISWPAYGGEDGLSILVRNQFPGVNTMKPVSFFLICYAVLIAALGLFVLIRGSRFGSALQAARQNEVRVATVGIAPYRIRLTAFALSAAMTGLAGALFADLNRFVSPSMLSWHMSGELIVLIILGGTGRLFGPLAGAALFVVFEYVLGGLTERWQFFLG